MDTTPLSILGYIPSVILVVGFSVLLLYRLFKSPCLLRGHDWELIDKKDMSKKITYTDDSHKYYDYIVYVFKCKNCGKLMQKTVFYT